MKPESEVQPMKPKPHLSMGLDDVQGMGDPVIDDRVTLLVTGRVVNLSTESMDGKQSMRMSLEIESMKRQHSSMSLSGHKP